MTRNPDDAGAPPATPAGAIPVLETKLYIPRRPAGLVGRPRLIERIRQARERKLTVISAPAGSGKTTLLAEWLAQARADDSPAGWVWLDSGDNEPASFWTYCIRALQKVQPGFAQHALAMLHAQGTPSVAVLTTLINAIDRDLTLILDDYHVIDAPAVHSGLAYFLDHLPPHMHVVIATRADPLLPLARMRARGEVTELRATDLRFTPEESSVFLNGVMDAGLSAADVATLEQRTEGWVAGLKLAALSMTGHDDVRRFIDAFSGDNRYIADYLIEEVLQNQSERVRRFLLGTAILDRLNESLCDAVTGESGSQAVLEMLEKSNLFVIALDDRRKWYRYHHLFAEVLHAYAAREDRERVRELHRRASAWYERSGATGDAVRHALRAEDMERVAELLERAWPAKDRSHQSSLWLARAKALPAALVDARPVLGMGYAWALLNAGELEAAEERLRAVEASLASLSSGDAGDAAVRALPREIATARVYLAQARGDTARTVEHARQLIDLVPDGDHATYATACALLALAHWATGELDAAHRTFSDALSGMRQAGDMLSVIRGTFVLGDIRAVQGRLSEAERVYHSGLQLASHNTLDGVPETDELYLGLSEVHHARGDMEAAALLLATVEQTSSRALHAVNRHRWCIDAARIAVAQGDLERALDLLTDAETHERRDPLPRVQPVPAIRARIRLAQGRINDAVKWMSEQGVGEHDDLLYVREFDHMTLARVLIARHRSGQNDRFLERALALLERIRAAAIAGGRLGSTIEATVLQSIAHQALGDTRAALDAIATALEMAEPEGYLRVFLDEGIIMRDLLRQATARGLAGAYTRRVLASFDEPSSPAPAPDAAPRAVAAPHVDGATASARALTPRELEILRLVAVGMRNREIADQLFISPATVKRHIANVYDKLDARHRTEALRRAGTLNLL